MIVGKGPYKLLGKHGAKRDLSVCFKRSFFNCSVVIFCVDYFDLLASKGIHQQIQKVELSNCRVVA